MLGRPLNINQMYKYFYTNILSYKRTILGGGSTTFQLFIFKDHPNNDMFILAPAISLKFSIFHLKPGVFRCVDKKTWCVFLILNVVELT